ncbi:protein-disulfide reductase DsbD domain-containing protein [Acidimangrovimonas pyrenivorans]|uniref:Protein-disulfide reductase DsbD domain-containing protein n=1 Tax=Acidimangrovimonas pyrenivorans TaxID=2030798 RepID=A0ABV7ALY1_9RHOB
MTPNRRPSRLFAAALSAAAVLLGGLACSLPARAEGFSPDKVVKAEVLPGWRMADGQRMAALHLRLADGWKTYWRAPGEAGIPPVFDWSGSTNLASARVIWPQPHVFDAGGMRSIGYKHDVVLPIEVTAADPSKPVALKAKVDIGVCRDICVPVALNLSADLAGKGAPDPAIRKALAAQPEPARKAGLTSAACAVEPIADGLRLTAQLDLPAQGGDETTVFELPDKTIWISQATTRRTGKHLTATADLVPATGAPFALDRSKVKITVLGAGKAVELLGCPAS